VKRNTPLRSRSLRGDGPKKYSTLKRGGQIKPKKRGANEFQRVYGSKERVEWVQSLPCLACGKGPSENAHTENGGMGRKAGYATIVPLCPEHHAAFDLHQFPFNVQQFREGLQAAASDRGAIRMTILLFHKLS